MTPPPSALGTLLAQRLDAVLGTTLAQHAHLMTSTRARAVSQTSQISRTRANATLTDPRQTLERLDQKGRDQHNHAASQGSARRVVDAATLRHERAELALESKRTGLAQLAPRYAHARFSNAARLILPLLAHYPERAPVLIDRQPLWPSAVTATTMSVPTHALTQALTQALVHTVATSGMFYESHLAELARAARTPAQLATEPQAHLPRVDTAEYTLTPAAALLVRQQLDVLAYQLFCWQGLLWPGVALDWQIQRRDTTAQTPEVCTSWQTRLRLVLPGLGIISAHLSLSGNALTLQLSAPACAATLQTRLAVLRRRYSQLGLTVTGLWLDERPIVPSQNPYTL